MHRGVSALLLSVFDDGGPFRQALRVYTPNLH